MKVNFCRNLKLFFPLLVITLFWLTPAEAYNIEPIQIDPARQDFVVGPGKTDLILNPGEVRVVEVMVSNRTGVDREFEIKFEDFVGSQDLTSAVVFTNDQGATTLKDYLAVPETKFFLRNGERARIPVTISIPEGAEPGGRYASILVSTLVPLDRELTDPGAKGGVPLISQSGTLVFVTIPGEIKREGKLLDFFISGKKLFYGSAEEVSFSLVFENTGRIHLRPYGTIAIKNLFGQDVKKIELSPWFAMPEAKRLREVNLLVGEEGEKSFLLGRYQAEAKIFRDYDNLSDTKTLIFWVVPWKLLLVILIALFLIIFLITWLIVYLKSHLQFKKKEENNPPSAGAPTPGASPDSPQT